MNKTTYLDFANAVVKIEDNLEWYSVNARKKYETELSWSVWLGEIEKIINGRKCLNAK